MTSFAITEQLDRLEEKLDGVDGWYNTKRACRYCDVSEKTLRRAVVKGTLKCSKATGKNLYLKSDMDKWLRNMQWQDVRI